MTDLKTEAGERIGSNKPLDLPLELEMELELEWAIERQEQTEYVGLGMQPRYNTSKARASARL